MTPEDEPLPKAVVDHSFAPPQNSLEARVCPQCGSDMQWRDSAGLTRMYPKGAWECLNQRCWNMEEPRDVPAEHPDQWMDNEPGATTFPEHWTASGNYKSRFRRYKRNLRWKAQNRRRDDGD